MRILYFSRDYTPHDHRFLSALAKTSHVVAYLRLEDQGRAFEERPLPAGIQNITWVGGHFPISFKDGMLSFSKRSLRLLFDLKRVVREFQPDIIHAGPIQSSALLVALTGFRHLVSVSWGYDLLLDAQRNGWWASATRFTLKRSAVLVGDCDTIRQQAVRYGMAPQRIVTFPWGVELDHFNPTPHGIKKEERPLRISLGWSQDAFILLSTRSWASMYGVEEIARAFVQAARRCPELRLIMLSNGAQTDLIRHIFSEAFGEKVGEKVFFAGQVAEREVEDYFHTADLYVSASHSDGTSISLLQAFACGCPALVSDIQGNREWVTPGEQGWWFPVGNIERLAQSMLQAVGNRHQLPEMGRAARRRAEQRGDWSKNFPQLLRAYEIACQAG